MVEIRNNICNCVSYVLSRVLEPKSDIVGLALLKIVAALWWEASRPDFCFSRGVVRSFYDVVTLGQTIRKRLPGTIYRRFIRTNCLVSGYRSRTWIGGYWNVATFLKTDVLKKLHTALDASCKVAGGSSNIAGPIRPFPGHTLPRRCRNLNL